MVPVLVAVMDRCLLVNIWLLIATKFLFITSLVSLDKGKDDGLSNLSRKGYIEFSKILAMSLICFILVSVGIGDIPVKIDCTDTLYILDVVRKLFVSQVRGAMDV